MYLLASLGFVFAALIEFAVVIILHHKKKKSPKISCTGIDELDSNHFKRFGARNQKLSVTKKKKQKIKILKNFDKDRSKENPPNEEDRLKMPRKVDLICFIAYLCGYCFFNIIYWIDMLKN